MTEQSMVEKCAIAISESEIGSRTAWGKCTEEWRAEKRRAARAAIEAMRSPTKEVIDAGYWAVDDAIDYSMGSDGSETTIDRTRAAFDAWQAMISEALK